MNYPYKIPTPYQTTNPNVFIADTTLLFGTIDKPVDAQLLIVLDYSQLVPSVVIKNYSFRITPGGLPNLSILPEPLTPTSNTISLFIEGGIEGQQYTVQVLTSLNTGETRVDILSVNVLGDGDNCGCIVSPPALPPSSVSGDGSVVVNEAPRFFVSATTPVGANVLDRWYNSTTGVVYDYVTNGAKAFWQAVNTFGGGGQVSVSPLRIMKMNTIALDGVAVTFTLTSTDATPVNIVNSTDLFVFIEGVWQEPGVQYSALNNTITFVQAPSSDASVFIVWLTDVVPVPISAIKTIKMQQIYPDGASRGFALQAVGSASVDVINSSDLFVSLDGVWQQPSIDYVAVGSVITFEQAPTADAGIFMLWISIPTFSVATIRIESITPDGTTTIFPLTALNLPPISITDATDIFVSLDGVQQEPYIQYTVSGNTITFATAPVADAGIFIIWFNTAS